MQANRPTGNIFMPQLTVAAVFMMVSFSAGTVSSHLLVKVMKFAGSRIEPDWSSTSSNSAGRRSSM